MVANFGYAWFSSVSSLGLVCCRYSFALELVDDIMDCSIVPNGNWRSTS